MQTLLQVFALMMLLALCDASVAGEMPRLRGLKEQTSESLSSCNSVCPKAAGAVLSLQESITQSLGPDANSLVERVVLERAGSEVPRDHRSFQLTKPNVTSIIHKSIESLLEGVCAHKEAFECLASNTDMCGPSSVSETVIMGLSLELAPMLGCLCDACPSNRQTLSDVIADTVLHKISANATAKNVVAKSRFELMCPLIHTVNNSCFTSHSQCRTFVSQIEAGVSSGSTLEFDNSLPQDEQLPYMVNLCNSLGYVSSTPRHSSGDAGDAQGPSGHSNVPESPPNNEKKPEEEMAINAAHGMNKVHMLVVTMAAWLAWCTA